MRTSTLLTIATAGFVAVNGEATNAYAPSVSIPESATAIQVQGGFDKVDALKKTDKAVKVMSDLAKVAGGFDKMVSATSNMGKAIGFLG
jgi:hypothetical protein